ncbi:MAG: PASTA domain-containing protein [Bacillota bacterium]
MKKNKKKSIIIGGLALLVIAVVSLAAIIYFLITDPQSVLLDHNFSSDRQYLVDEEFSESIVNIAVLGFDRNAEREQYAYLFLPDFIAVLSINFETGDVAFVRVLRDSYVPIAVTGIKDKINHSYYHGYMHGGGTDRDTDGLQCTLDTVSAALGGVPIHYYVSVNMDGLAYLVDAIGGVEYRVKENLYDKFGNRILKKGTHYFTGEQFVLFVRHRDDNSGQDVGRATRQFDILDDLFESLRDKGMLNTIPTLFKVYRDYIETDLTLKQVAALVYYAKDFDPKSDMFYYLDGTSQTKDGIWYWVLNQAQRVSLIQQVFGITAQLWPQEVLTDTPPPPLKAFNYDMDYDSMGRSVVELSWVPGDDKKLRYELYRDNELILQTEQDDPVTEYIDTDVDEGDTYTYTLKVFHYRAEGPPASLTVYVPAPAVPDVTGITQLEAKTIIENAGFVFGVVIGEDYHETIDTGRVISTQPAAGTEAVRGTTINLVVSRGLKVAVPNVTNKTQGEAQTLIGNAGLVFGVVERMEFHATIPVNKVIRSVPAAGTKVNPNSTVNVVLSKGPAIVPNLFEMPQGEAQTAITNAGLVVGTITNQPHDSIPSGNVISQSPAAWTQVSPGTSVNLFVSSGP